MDSNTSLEKEEISSALTVRGTDVLKEKEEVTALQRSENCKWLLFAGMGA